MFCMLLNDVEWVWMFLDGYESVRSELWKFYDIVQVELQFGADMFGLSEMYILK